MDHEPDTFPETDDDLLGRLRAANPVSLDESQASSWDGADSLFSRITSRPPGFDPYVDPASGERSGRSRRPLLAAVAAAVVLLVGAVAVMLPGGGQPALATVTSAAEQTAGANSGRVVTAFSVSGEEDAVVENIYGTITATFSDEDVAVSIDIDPGTTAFSAQEASALSAAETRLVDGEVFLTSDGQEWVSLQAPEFVRSALADLTDLRSTLGQVNELVEVTEIGEAEIDGVAVTRYQSQIDLADQSLAESGWFPGMDGPQAQAIDIEAEGLVTIDLYVDGDGLMRRIEISGEAKPADPGVDGSVDFSIITDFLDLGSDITIEAPEASATQPLTELERDE
jgi:hypothetical protein